MIKNLPVNAGDTRDSGLIPGLKRSPGVGNVSLPEKLHGQRSPVGYSARGCKESGMTECASARTHTHTHPRLLLFSH